MKDKTLLHSNAKCTVMFADCCRRRNMTLRSKRLALESSQEVVVTVRKITGRSHFPQNIALRRELQLNGVIVCFNEFVMNEKEGILFSCCK